MAPHKLAVVDASVVLKWQLDDEECIRQAAALRDDYYLQGTIKLVAPQLLTFEVVNGIAAAAKRQRISSDRAIQAINNLLELGVGLIEIGPLRILQLSLRYQLAAYDSAYLALAEQEDCDLWTGDRAFWQALAGESSRVKWIGDYRSNGK